MVMLDGLADGAPVNGPSSGTVGTKAYTFLLVLVLTCFGPWSQYFLSEPCLKKI